MVAFIHFLYWYTGNTGKLEQCEQAEVHQAEVHHRVGEDDEVQPLLLTFSRGVPALSLHEGPTT